MTILMQFSHAMFSYIISLVPLVVHLTLYKDAGIATKIRNNAIREQSYLTCLAPLLLPFSILVISNRVFDKQKCLWHK